MLKIGHRGAAGHEPENTLRSFQKAMDFGVDMIELDVQVCATGELVVIHDDEVDRTTGGSGLVSIMTLADLKKLDAGRGERIPLLSEVLDLVDRRVKVNIELKGRGTARPVAELINAYVRTKSRSYDEFLFSSFRHQEILDFAKICPEAKLGLLYEDIPKNISKHTKHLNVFSINISRKYADKKTVDAIHALGFAVLVWTVNERDEIKKLQALGVDGIFSDFPDRF